MQPYKKMIHLGKRNVGHTCILKSADSAKIFWGHWGRAAQHDFSVRDCGKTGQRDAWLYKQRDKQVGTGKAILPLFVALTRPLLEKETRFCTLALFFWQVWGGMGGEGRSQKMNKTD